MHRNQHATRAGKQDIKEHNTEKLRAVVAVLCCVSLSRRASTGISAATVNSLEVLWQVQATIVGLVFALAVFVFGLLPQGRGRLTYREFLQRTWALPLTIFNVGSLLFNGMVLLGVGHQVPSSATAVGHGWAVTVASVVALTSIASILVLLVRTIRAIDPATSEKAQRDYRHQALAQAVCGELLEQAGLSIMSELEASGVCVFNPVYLGPGWQITAAKREVTIVRDVSIWRLRLLKSHAAWKHRKLPVVRVWPECSIGEAASLMIIDQASGRLSRWWARRCVRVGRIKPDVFDTAIQALYAETLDDIRADRPIEAVQGLRTLADLHEPMWQAYTAHGGLCKTLQDAQ
jgi:hypothetical protein